MKKPRICVTGAGGFIGTHLIRYLKSRGYWVRGVDLKWPQWSETEADEFYIMDLRRQVMATEAMRDVDWVFALAADMGGMGFITTHDAEIISNNTLINMNSIAAARKQGVSRYLFSSSACVYPMYLQDDDARPLAECDAYPADPQAAYGWEKLHAEHLCRYYREAGWLDTCVVRFHNCYGPEGSWNDGREKAPAALCRKVAMAELSGYPEVEIWGDGGQVRSYMYVGDCVDGLLRVMQAGYPGPLNIGRDREITVDALADAIAGIAGIEIDKVHVPGPEGVRRRNSDNTLCRQVLDWEPTTPVEEGLVPTYEWVREQVRAL